MIIKLHEKKIKLVNFQELRSIEKLQNANHVILPSGLIELASPDLALTNKRSARAALSILLEKFDENIISVPIRSIQSHGESPLVTYKKWFNIQEGSFNPYATAIYWAYLINKNHVEATSPIPNLTGGATLSVNFLPKCITAANNPDPSLADYIKCAWNSAPTTLPLFNITGQHPSFCQDNCGIHTNPECPELLIGWMHIPALLGQLESHWLGLAPSIPNFKTGIPDNIRKDLNKHFTELFLVQGDNIIATRTALFCISKTLQHNNIEISNPIWQRIAHLSPTI